MAMILLFFQVNGTLQGGAKVEASGAAPPTTLLSIAVEPATASVAVGSTATFTATGTYTNASTANVTSMCVWTSSNMDVATIGGASSPQVVNAISNGTAGITCAVGNITETAQLTVTGLSITGPVPFPAGVEGATFTATFTASGGTPPYTFSISSNYPALQGIGLAFTTPTLTGTLPTSSVGTHAFTVTVNDSGSLTATRNFVLTIGPAGGLSRVAQLPQVWANPHEADLPGSGVVIKHIRANNSGDYPCTLAGLQASMDNWAAQPNNVWWLVKIDDSLSAATGGRCVISSNSPFLLKPKTSGVATGFLIYESEHPNPNGRIVCNRIQQVSLVGPSPRNPGCATTPGIDDLEHMWKLTTTSTQSMGNLINPIRQINADGYGPTHIVIRDMEGIQTAYNLLANVISTVVCIDSTGPCADGVWSPTKGITTHIGLERNYIHGDHGDDARSATGSQTRNILYIGCGMCWIEWNYFDGMSYNAPSGSTGEGHGISLTNGQPGLKIAHNFVEGGEITIMSGGAMPFGGGLLTDTEIRGNIFTMNPAWMLPRPGLTPSALNCRLARKNPFELKMGARILLDGNVLENNISCGQIGQGSLFNAPSSYGGQGNWNQEIVDVTYSNNVIRHTINGQQSLNRANSQVGTGEGAGRPGMRWNYINNLFYDISNCCSRSGSPQNVMQTGNQSQANWTCSGVRDADGATTTLTCASNQADQPVWNTQTGVVVGDPVSVFNCTPSSFSTGPAGSTSVSTTLGPAALPGTNGMETNGVTVVYPNPGTPNETTGGVGQYRILSAVRVSGTATLGYLALAGSRPIEVGDTVRVLGISPNTGFTAASVTVTARVATGNTGTFSYANSGGDVAFTPQLGGMAFIGAAGTVGCTLRIGKGWPSETVSIHNTYVFSADIYHPATSGNCSYGGLQARGNTVQDDIAVGSTTNYYIGYNCTFQGAAAQANGYDLNTLIYNHDFFSYTTRAPSLTVRSYPGPPSDPTAGYDRNDPNAFLWIGLASGVGCTGATADTSCLGWNGMMNGAAWIRDPGEANPPQDPLVFYALSPSSLYHAGNVRQAHDGTDLGADMEAIRTALSRTQYTGCSTNPSDPRYCGPTGPFPD